MQSAERDAPQRDAGEGWHCLHVAGGDHTGSPSPQHTRATLLLQVGIACVRLEGCMSLEQRDKAISSFTNDPNVRVFLMSLKAGGVALNLTAVSTHPEFDVSC